MHGNIARRGLWVVTAAAWAAAGTLWHYGLHDRHAADLLAVTASLASVGVGVSLWYRIRRAEQSVLTTWFESPALARRVTELEGRCAAMADNTTQAEALSRALTAAFEHAGLPVPDGLECRRHLRVVCDEKVRG